MLKKKLVALSFLVILAALIVAQAKAIRDADYSIRSVDNFKSFCPQGLSILFQEKAKEHPYYDYVALLPVTGDFNGTNCHVWVAPEYGGKFEFTAQENATVQVGTNLNPLVNGAAYGDGDRFQVTVGQVYVVEWGYKTAPFLPILFIVGMIGVVSMISGPCYAVYKVKKKEYEEGLVNGVIIFAIGFGFFVGWLAMA